MMLIKANRIYFMLRIHVTWFCFTHVKSLILFIRQVLNTSQSVERQIDMDLNHLNISFLRQFVTVVTLSTYNSFSILLF